MTVLIWILKQLLMPLHHIESKSTLFFMMVLFQYPFLVFPWLGEVKSQWLWEEIGRKGWRRVESCDTDWLGHRHLDLV